MTKLSEDQIPLPSQLPRPENALMIWVIYDHPRDFPDGYVLRPQALVEGVLIVSAVAWSAATPDKLEAILPAGVTRIGPQEGDDPVIMSVWIE